MSETEGKPNRDEVIRGIVHRAFHDSLVGDERLRTRRRRLTEEELAERLDGLKRCLATSKSQLARNDLASMWEAAGGFLAEYGHREDFDDPEDVKKLLRECQKGFIAALQIEIEREQGNYENPFDAVKDRLVEASRTPSAAAQPQARASVKTLKAVAEQYMQEKVSGGNWEPKTAITVRSVFNDLFEVLGAETDITSITRAQLTDFRSKVMKLPANRDKIAAYRGKTIAEIMAMPDVSPMGHSTLRKRMVWTTTFFKWCSRQDHIAKSPAEGLVPAQSKRPASKERDPYSQADLKKLVSALATLPLQPKARQTGAVLDPADRALQRHAPERNLPASL